VKRGQCDHHTSLVECFEIVDEIIVVDTVVPEHSFPADLLLLKADLDLHHVLGMIQLVSHTGKWLAVDKRNALDSNSDGVNPVRICVF
jgi:hypothetical protein